MPTPEYTVEDQLVTDLVTYFTAHPPASLSIVHFRGTTERPLPALIIGHEGVEMETAKGMTGTGRVNLRLVITSDMDVTTPDAHKALVAAVDLAAMAIAPTTLALSYVHAVLRESPANKIDDRRTLSVLAYTVIATRCTSV